MPIPPNEADAVNDVLEFWFTPHEGEQAPRGFRKCWFEKNAEFDKELKRRFEPLVNQAISGALDHWADEPNGVVALLLLLDQMPRNIYRDKKRMYIGDKRALPLAKQALEAGLDARMSPPHRLFVYLPLEHAESLEEQDRCYDLMSALDEVAPQEKGSFADWAEKHRAVIRRFGRFPHRNELLGRENTAEEEAFLNQPDAPKF